MLPNQCVSDTPSEDRSVTCGAIALTTKLDRPRFVVTGVTQGQQCF
jgi:hypothetical protein